MLGVHGGATASASHSELTSQVMLSVFLAPLISHKEEDSCLLFPVTRVNETEILL